uniref:Sodium-coupled monocarboxylate transporter 1-like n=2 Tax=Hirondellea gigas TaxID=1518452 RepID=A0A6A7FWQ0_9CRUS
MADLATVFPTLSEIFTTEVPTTLTYTEELAGRFGWPDYLVFSAMLLVSIAIGFYYGFVDKSGANDTTEDFLLAGKSMTTFPIAMSLIASFMSAITLLGTPSEVYQNGFVYYLIGFSYFLVMPSAAYLYLPVFWDLQVTSAYEYLEWRFHPYCRRLGSAVFILQMVMYMAIVVYAPALALAQVTGINLLLSVCLICFVCIFYTTLGGMKAVLWTDTLQVVIMYITMLFIVIYGTISIGGFKYVWQEAVNSGRDELINFDPNPTTRHTVWSLIIGGYFTWVTIYGCNQAQVQRYLCVKKLYMARRALWINLVGLVILMLVSSFAGLVIYAKYKDCDPLRSGIVTAGDQLFPLFVMDTMGQFRGLPGLFVAGIFSGALSTVSSGMNSLAAITLEDFIKGLFFPNMSEKTATRVSKGLTVLYGLITFGGVFIAQLMGDVLSAALSIFGMVGGPLLGMFTLGMFFPWANAVGCFVGTVVSLLFMMWIGFGFQIAKSFGYIVSHAKETSIEGCAMFVNETLAILSPTTETSASMWDLSIFKMSYMWYSATGCMTVIIVGMIVSLISGKQNVRELDPRTISPGYHWVNSIIPITKDLGEDFKNKQRKKSEADSGEHNLAYVVYPTVPKEAKYTEESSRF